MDIVDSSESIDKLLKVQDAKDITTLQQKMGLVATYCRVYRFSEFSENKYNNRLLDTTFGTIYIIFPDNLFSGDSESNMRRSPQTRAFLVRWLDVQRALLTQSNLVQFEM